MSKITALPERLAFTGDEQVVMAVSGVGTRRGQLGSLVAQVAAPHVALAQQAAAQATAAAATAAFNRKVYATVAAGLADTVEGDHFFTPGATPEEFLLLWSHDAGLTATLRSAMPSADLLVALQNSAANADAAAAIALAQAEAAIDAGGQAISQAAIAAAAADTAIDAANAADEARNRLQAHSYSFEVEEEGQVLFILDVAPVVPPVLYINGVRQRATRLTWDGVDCMIDPPLHAGDEVDIVVIEPIMRQVVDAAHVIGLSDPTGADAVGSKYPLANTAARPVGDCLSDRMPSIWDFYRPDLGDTLDDWSPQMNRASTSDHDIYFSTARRPQGYDLLSPVTQNAGGQMYYGDPTGTGPGAGTEFNISPDFPLDGPGVIIIPSNLTERGSGLSNIGFRFAQPDTYNRADLIQYPYAVYARNVARMQLLGRVTVYLGYRGFDLLGNNGGMKIDELRLCCFENGLAIDGSYDKSNINHIELWPYGCGASTESQGLYSIYSDGVARGMDIGRMDGFSAHSIKTFRQRILIHPAVYWDADPDVVGSDGFGTIGELHLDGTLGRLEISGSKVAIGSWYATTGVGNDFFIRQTAGALSLGPCGWGLGAGGEDGDPLIQVAGGRFMNNGGGFYEAIPTKAALLKQTGGDVMWFGGNIASGKDQIRDEAFFDVSGGRITLKNPRFIDPGTGSGDCVRITNDDWHDVEINATLTRGFQIPAPGGSGTYKFGATMQAPVL